MTVQTLRSNNQVTLPAELVRRVGLNIGDPIEFQIKRGCIVIKAYSSSKYWDEETLSDINKAASGPFKVFSSMDKLEHNLNV